MNLQYESTKNFRIYEVNILKRGGKLKAIWLKIDHHSLKMKAVYSIFKRLIENDNILEDKNQEGNLIEMMI